MEAQPSSLVERAQQSADACAIVDADGRHSYAELLDASARIASALLDGARDLEGARVCFLIAPSFRYVATQWGIFRAGGVAVPLCVSHPEPELAHVIDDAVASIVIADPEFDSRLRPLTAARSLRHLNAGELAATERRQALPLMAAERPASRRARSPATRSSRRRCARSCELGRSARAIGCFTSCRSTICTVF